ncbi:MAG: hypothetical protein WBC97_03920 [Gemmatimonadales bacterium]
MSTLPWPRATLLPISLMLLAACSTGPSTGCKLTTTGPVTLSSACGGVTFVSVDHIATYADTVRGPATVTFDISAAFAPTTGYGYGSDDGDDWVVTIADSSARWITSTHYPVVGGQFDLKISSVQLTRTSGDTTTFATHGTLDAKLAPDSTTDATGTVTLHLTF